MLSRLASADSLRPAKLNTISIQRRRFAFDFAWLCLIVIQKSQRAKGKSNTAKTGGYPA
jgi:hypothetical protein